MSQHDAVLSRAKPVADSCDAWCRFDNWKPFLTACEKIPPNTTLENACLIVGLDYATVDRLIGYAISDWRHSTSTSMLQALAGTMLGECPKEAKQVFTSHLWQTRFLIMAGKNGFARGWLTCTVRDKTGAPIIVGAQRAQTLRPNDTEKFNDLLRGLYLHWLVNDRSAVSLPKHIYRGIRAGNLLSHATFKNDCIERIEGEHYAFFAKRRVQRLRGYLCSDGLQSIAETPLLPFSASKSVASHFARGEGLILRIDPRLCHIITSEQHDARLSGKDRVTGRVEREYIIRLPKDHRFSVDDIIINDRETLIAENSPLAVGFFNHDNYRARYRLRESNIEAQFAWRSNQKGGLVFKVSNDLWFMGRGQFRTKYGFDPLPTSANLPEITDFRIDYDKGWTYNRKWVPVTMPHRS